MPTPAQIDEQVELERDQIRQGLKRLRDNTRKLEEKEYASAAIYGVASIDVLLPLVVQQIEDTNQRIRKGNAGKAFKEITQYLSDLEPLAAAAITCKLTIDKVFSVKEGSNQLVNVCDAIGQAVEAECQMRHYEKHAPGLLEVLKKNYWHRSIGTHQKIVVIQTLMNRYEVQQWKTWGRANRVQLGGWLLECVMQSSGWFTKEMRQEGRKRVNYVVPTPEFLSIKDQVMQNAELFSPLAWPMLIEPNDWTNEKPGGYLLNEIMRGHDMVRRGNKGCIQGEKPIAFLNKIQKVAYTLNPFTVEIAEILQERQRSVGKFLPIVNHDLPPKPADIAENAESRKVYRRAAAEVMNENAQEFKRSCRTRMTMEAVARFKGVERWFVPHSFDYRGRVYGIPAFLTFQDTDFGKSLIRFADESFMDESAENWIRFQVATTYGLDKATMSERLSWTYEHEDLITRIAEDPIGCLPEWEVAEEPWQFVSAVDEMYHCLIKRDKVSTGLPIAIDATCSGLQILAGMAKDKSTAQLVNVIPAEKPQDAYKVVAEKSKPNIPNFLHPFWDRRSVKRVVMTLPYNAKPFSNRSYIREALKEKGIEIERDDLTVCVQAVRDAMSAVVPGPMNVMKWIEDEVSKAIKRGAKKLTWVTPSGFVVSQKLMKKQVERLQLQLLGKCELYVATDDKDVVDKSRHKAATAPNLIHSLDASLLCLSVIRFDAPIALIHDSVLCRATDMDELSKVVREIYLHLFAEHNYLTDFASQIGAETEPPIIGDLEPSKVIDSTYFFC
jgi:DNA-directed RNA polymerase